jgi:2-polyprenyl-6-methoxyphenol hydroxylase-like FAD-dependent oxidoreductase
MTVLKERVDVLIVGGGIAGAALACALSDTGLSILLIDRSDRPLDTARGDHLQPRTLEILREWGILDHMVTFDT